LYLRRRQSGARKKEPTMSDQSQETSVPETPYSSEAAAIAALANPDPDGPTVRIRAAWRDLSCAGSGPEAYRRVRYPGATTDEWPDCDRLPAPGIRASERRCTEYCEVPIGTLVTTYERSVYRGRRGRCSISFGVAVPGAPGAGAGALVDCSHRTLRSRPVYEVTLPDGSKVEIARRV
jgi:hypothetical protein